MDYAEIPRSIIYKDRSNLNDFGVQNPGTINHYLFTQMRKMTLLQCGDGKTIALNCFNNAYYICTLILLDEFPDLCMDKYEQKLFEKPCVFQSDVYQASMALVCVLLGAYDEKWKQRDDILINSIHNWVSSNRWTGRNEQKSFRDIIKTCSPDGLYVPADAFAPRDIIEVVENAGVYALVHYSEYICERLALLEDTSRRKNGTDMAIAKLKDGQLKICKDSQYDPKTDSFKNDSGDCHNDVFQWGCDPRKEYRIIEEAIKYYTEYYLKVDSNQPENRTDSALIFSGHKKVVADNSCLEEQLAKRTKEVNELKKENAELKRRLSEFLETVEELPAEQKVRMAFSLQLLKAAGLTDEVLNQKKSNVAKVIHLITGIGANNNGKYPPTQICQNWLVDKQYYPERNEITLIELNTLCAQLGLNNAFLILGSQGSDKV